MASYALSNGDVNTSNSYQGMDPNHCLRGIYTNDGGSVHTYMFGPFYHQHLPSQKDGHFIMVIGPLMGANKKSRKYTNYDLNFDARYRCMKAVVQTIIETGDPTEKVMEQL